jgi:hypothetical protein
MSFTRNSIKFEQFLAILKMNLLLVFKEIIDSKMSNDEFIPFNGFLNSWAADANDNVLSLDILFI